jgi:hypothetical protein
MGPVTQTIITTVVSVGVPAFFGFLALQLRRRRTGQLTRRRQDEARDMEQSQSKEYIAALREQIVGLGGKPKAAPRKKRPRA